MTRQGPSASAPTESGGGITFHNRLHPGHPYQTKMDDVLRVALRDLPGPWDVSAQALDRAWFRIDIVAPDRESWSLSVPVHEGPRLEDLADRVRAFCVRHCSLHPERAERPAGGPGDGPAATRDLTPNPGSSPTEVAAVSSPATAERNLK